MFISYRLKTIIILLLHYKLIMRQIFYTLLFLFVPFLMQGQVQNPRGRTSEGRQSMEQQTKEERAKPPITDYKIITVSNDTTFVDTTLTIEEDYRFNYLRKDRFELLPFSNVGQTYNRLSYEFERKNLLPEFGARARHFNFFEVEDVNYYRVPTPFTELFFRTVFEQGQVLDAFFTVNTSPNLNFSVAYKGLRSLGKYQHILTSTGNFRAAVNYHTQDQKYHLKTHFVSQDLMNEENGGLNELSLEQYLAGEEEIEDRSRLDVNFENAQSTLFGKRFYLDHRFYLNGAGEAENFFVRHKLNFSDKEYLYEQGSASPLFGPAYETSGLRDETSLENVYNEASLNYRSDLLGEIGFKGGLTNYNYGYNSTLDLESGYIGNRLKGDMISVGGNYAKTIGSFDFHADGMINVSGDFEGNYLQAGLSYSLMEDIRAFVMLSTSSQAPNFNFLLYQSDYVNYNWQNDFSNVSTQKLDFSVVSPRFFNLNVEYTRIANYSFFGLNQENQVRPMQYSETVNYVRAKAEKEFVFGKFALNNTLLYQKVLDGASVLNVPDFITRNSLYYQDHWFQRALYLQTGFTFNYFSNYHMNGYDPVLSEFYVQNQQEMEGFPRVDFFFNGKIRQAHIFFKLEQVHTLLTENDNFSAPLYPYRDFGVRFVVEFLPLD